MTTFRGGRRLSTFFRLGLATFAMAAAVGVNAAAASSLTLPEALARAAAFDPGRPASTARVAAAEAGARQAGVRPNPTVGVDLENFAGTGDFSLLDRSEATLYYQQTWERGGKRSARSDVARAEVSLARARGEVRALDLLAQVQSTWVEALAADAVVALAEERLRVAERLRSDTARRVQAARDPLMAGQRAQTAQTQARIARDQAVAEARQARASLAAFWGADDVELDPAALEQTGPERVTATDTTNLPDVAVLDAERELATARIRLEQARAVQDPSLRAGVRRFGDGNEVAVVVGGSIPLGRNDTNKGSIERAQAERIAAEADLLADRTVRAREVSRLVARRAASLAEVRRIDGEVLPSASRAVSLARDGFNRGGGAFTYQEVAEAQRTLIDAKARRIDLLKSFHLDGARLERLTGRHAALIAAEPR